MLDEKNNVIKKSAISGFIWGFAERSLSQIMTMVISIILARILSPDDYSVISIVNIFFAFCNILIIGGFSTALIQKKDADVLDYSTIFYFSLLISFVLYVIIFVTAPFIAGLYHKNILIPVFKIMGINLFIVSIRSVVNSYVSKCLNFRYFFYSTLVSIMVSGIVGIIMALQGYGVWALVAQQMISGVVSVLMLICSSKFKVVLKFSFERLRGLFEYGWKILTANIINTVYDEVTPLIIGIKFSSVDLAYYTKGKSFPSLINNTVTGTMSTVLFPIMSKIQDNKKTLLAATRNYIKCSSYLIFPIMVGFLAISNGFTRLVLTDKWLPIVPYIQIFSVSYMFNMIQTGNLNAIQAIGRSDIILKLEIIKKVTYFIVIALFVFFFDSPILLAVTSIMCTIIATIVNTYPNRKLIDYKYRYQIADIMPNLVISIIMGVIVILMDNLDLNLYILVPVQIIVGIVVYLFLSIITKNESYLYLIKNVMNFVGGKNEH